MKKNQILRLTYAALCLALCMVLPLVTGQIPKFGQLLSPMHLPVLLCGFLCGWQYAALVGAVAPLLRYAIFGMPPIMPVGIPMVFELAVYGLAAAIVYNKLSKKTYNIYVSLFVAMILGRIVGGIAKAVLLGINGTSFPISVFLTSYFVETLPGIIVQIIIIPIIVIALKKANLLPNE